jgi:hypothetical protein
MWYMTQSRVPIYNEMGKDTSLPSSVDHVALLIRSIFFKPNTDGWGVISPTQL